MKLIRNKIPNLINNPSKIGQIETDEMFLNALAFKIYEEANEAMKAIIDNKGEDEVLEELGDVFEVIKTIMGEYGFTMEDLEEQCEFKNEERGSFSDGYLLKD